MTKKAFFNALEKIKRIVDVKNTAMIFHFRIGTQGLNNISNCHPFPITDELQLLKQKRVITDIAIAHNGIITSCSAKLGEDETISDTMIFIKDYLHLLHRHNKGFYKDKNLQKLIVKFTNSKFAVLDRKGKITMIGDFVYDEGIYYSNESYLDCYYKYYSGAYTGAYDNVKYLSDIQEEKANEKLNYKYKKLMFVEECTLEDGSEYESGELLMDDNYNIYIYDYSLDIAIFLYSGRIYNNKFELIKFIDAESEYIKIQL